MVRVSQTSETHFHCQTTKSQWHVQSCITGSMQPPLQQEIHHPTTRGSREPYQDCLCGFSTLTEIMAATGLSRHCTALLSSSLILSVSIQAFIVVTFVEKLK